MRGKGDSLREVDTHPFKGGIAHGAWGVYGSTSGTTLTEEQWTGARRCAELLERARRNPAGLRFAELCSLAECHGWVFTRQRGSHRLFERLGDARLMNFQEDRGMAKPYQVRQLLRALDDEGSSP